MLTTYNIVLAFHAASGLVGLIAFGTSMLLGR